MLVNFVSYIKPSLLDELQKINFFSFYLDFFFFKVLLQSHPESKRERTGGRSLMAKSATHWHWGEPRATNGQAQKIPCRPPQFDHKA